MNRFTNLRTMVDRFLVDTCTIRDVGDEPTIDDDTMEATFTAGDIVYEGRCWVRPYRLGEIGEIGGAQTTTSRYLLTLPVDAAELKVNQQVTIDGSGDPYLLGRTLRIESIEAGSDGPYRRCLIVDVQDQAEWAEVGS